jgi:SHS2 domain-containing protein
MSYEYLDDIAIADIAFIAHGESLEELFTSAFDATLNVMVENIDSIEKTITRKIEILSETLDMLLFRFLQELIFLKDAHQLLLRISHIKVSCDSSSYILTAELYGEKINREKHALNVDVKAVTLHLFEVKETESGWEARVVLDV